MHIIRDEESGNPVDCYIWVAKGSEQLLWQRGSCCKGILSRAKPTWLGRYKRAIAEDPDTHKQFIEDATMVRRAERRAERSGLSENQTNDPHRLDTMKALTAIDPSEQAQMEPIQLLTFEALFLCSLGVLEIRDPTNHKYTYSELWQLLLAINSSDDEFALKYAAYYYYCAKGWTVLSGLKFGSDFLLYGKGGPRALHSQYSVIVRQRGLSGNMDDSWQYMFALSRVTTQVRKALIICYVDPPCTDDVGEVRGCEGPDLTKYQIQECLIERFNPNRK
ncbi:tRNA splicing endonuclease subunit sen2 [Coemansia erecta]|nr:tRNA splicing endonuclease subunit sen2 [Coemansia erecta]